LSTGWHSMIFMKPMPYVIG